MDDFLQDIHFLIFKEYVKNYDYKNVLNVERNKDSVVIHTKYSTSNINFYANNIIELQIINTLTNDNEFYLHFQMKTLSHAVELFTDMLKDINKLVHKPKKKVLLSCTGGLTTTLFASNLNDCAKMLHKNYSFDAVGFETITNVIDDYDIVLLAPQISYRHASLQGTYNNKIVLKIEPEIFAKYDASKMIQVIDETQLSYEKKNKNSPVILNDILYTKGEILSIIIIRNSLRIHVGYRLYGINNEVLEDNEIIKTSFTLSDFYDIIDTLLIDHHHIDAVSITTPGIINEGRVTSLSINGLDKDTSNANEIDLKGALEKRYPLKVFIYNDANSVAVGYHACQSTYHNISVLFQPVSTNSGIGHIIDDKLHKGYKSLSGEMQYLPLVLSASRFELNKTVEGTIELLTQQILSIIISVAPEEIVICSQLLPSAKLIKEELKKYIPEKFIPQIVRITYLQDYAFIGGYISAIRELYM